MLVMNTIPSTFNERRFPHTVIGGALDSPDTPDPLTVILLNRGGRFYRSAVFQSLESAGITSVISVETSAEPYDVENLSLRFPRVRFLVPLEKVSVGELINTAMAETQSPHALVLWSDQRLPPSGIPKRVLDRLAEDPVLCVAPSLTGQRLENLPVHMVPAFEKKKLTIAPFPGGRDQSQTLYPFDFSGIYDRNRFIELGGFDQSIPNPYWQNLDFGFRAALWGEKIAVSAGFRISYEGEVPREDVTPDSSYVTFYLKNLAPSIRSGMIRLPWTALATVVFKGGLNVFEAFARFAGTARWIDSCRTRFVTDAGTLISSWDLP